MFEQSTQTEYNKTRNDKATRIKNSHNNYPYIYIKHVTFPNVEFDTLPSYIFTHFFNCFFFWRMKFSPYHCRTTLFGNGVTAELLTFRSWKMTRARTVKTTASLTNGISFRVFFWHFFLYLLHGKKWTFWIGSRIIEIRFNYYFGICKFLLFIRMNVWKFRS